MYVIIALGVFALIVIYIFDFQMTSLVNLATITSFVVAPIVGWMNLKLMNKKYLKEKSSKEMGSISILRRNRFLECFHSDLYYFFGELIN